MSTMSSTAFAGSGPVQRSCWPVLGAVILLAASLVAGSPPAQAAPRAGDGFDVYRAVLDGTQRQRLTAGTDNWTTLPDTGGLTTTDNGFGCQFNGFDPQPFLAHYWCIDCEPKGTTGDWNAVSNDSGGWQSFGADLSAYAGKKVEVSISDLSDGYSSGFGAFLDDVQLDVDGATVART